jgi:hypothetical protein
VDGGGDIVYARSRPQTRGGRDPSLARRCLRRMNKVQNVHMTGVHVPAPTMRTARRDSLMLDDDSRPLSGSLVKGDGR